MILIFGDEELRTRSMHFYRTTRTCSKVVGKLD